MQAGDCKFVSRYKERSVASSIVREIDRQTDR